MNERFKKEKIFTIPNLLSVVRLLLIPVIIWLYFNQNYIGAILVLVLSGVTDIVDGYIARHFNMISDLGKILDPIADKLTQFSLMACLAITYKKLLGLCVLFAIKELGMAIFGYLAIKHKDSVNSAKWHGKLNTVVIYFVILLLILFPDMKNSYVTALVVISAVTMIISFILYAMFYKGLLKNERT